jgi:hypothetical protein
MGQSQNPLDAAEGHPPMYENQPYNPPPKPPLQFSLRAMLAMTVAVSLLFGTLRWLEVPPLASAVVLVILMVSVVAALGLVLAIAHAIDRHD